MQRSTFNAQRSTSNESYEQQKSFDLEDRLLDYAATIVRAAPLALASNLLL
jgi:hypothetical protein